MTKIEGPFLAAKVFNTNLIQCRPPYYVIVSNVYICSFTCRISYVLRRAPSRTNSWSMVSILDSLHCFSFQFNKNDSATM